MCNEAPPSKKSLKGFSKRWANDWLNNFILNEMQLLSRAAQPRCCSLVMSWNEGQASCTVAPALRYQPSTSPPPTTPT